MIAIAFKRIYILYLYIDKYMTRYSIQRNYLYHQSKLTGKRCRIKFKLSVFYDLLPPASTFTLHGFKLPGIFHPKNSLNIFVSNPFLFIALKLFSLYFARNMITWQMQSI